MNQPRITAKITFLGASDGGRDVPPANLASGQYRPHIVIDPHQPTAVAIDDPEETYLGVTFENGPAQINSWTAIFGGPCVDVLAQHQIRGTCSWCYFYNSGGRAYCWLWSCRIRSDEGVTASTVMKKIATAGNTVVPALLALEKLGFVVAIEQSGDAELFRATRGDETYLAEDPVAVLGLVKLVEMRGWEWQPSDVEIDEVMRRYELG